ncbi:hypothetical protein MMC07_008448 [Pseudocyphellaria aurata]|nr:hypothetical protein [Pseudocyphellaria aurata]
MSSYDRIPKNVYLIIPTILFAFSVLFVLARTTLRLRYQKRLFIDDAFLFFAEICLCASVGLLYAFADQLFFDEARALGWTVAVPPDYSEKRNRSQKLSDAFIILTFTSIFAVKFSFLFFFRILIRRMHKMVVYWWTVVAVTTVAWIVCVLENFVLCPYEYYEQKSTACGQTSSLSTILGLYALVTILDIMTDILIIAIPVQVLWNVRIKRRQKIILGATLCLSIVMVLTAIIRISAFRIGNENIDVIWGNFWQIVESCLAVAVVCLLAFRSIFVGTQAQVKQAQKKQWYVLKKHPQNTRKHKNWMDLETEETGALPEIPRPTMTGLKTFIRGKPHPEESVMHSLTLDESNDQNTLHDDRIPTQIWVDYSISHETDEV